MLERTPAELAGLHVPSSDWSKLTCERCDGVMKVRN